MGYTTLSIYINYLSLLINKTQICSHTAIFAKSYKISSVVSMSYTFRLVCQSHLDTMCPNQFDTRQSSQAYCHKREESPVMHHYNFPKQRQQTRLCVIQPRIALTRDEASRDGLGGRIQTCNTANIGATPTYTS